MAIRFRRSIKLIPGVHLNIGKTGVSVSAGIRGASITAGKRGVYGNVGLTGTGLSYRTKLSDLGSIGKKVNISIDSQSSKGCVSKFHLNLDNDGRVKIVDNVGIELSGSQLRGVVDSNRGRN